MSPDNPFRRESLVHRNELAFAVLAFVLGGVLRLRGLSQCSLSHFDEGVYAITGFWPWTGRFFPSQEFFSPAGYPGLIGVANMALGRPEPLTGAWLSVASSLGIMAVGWRWSRSLGGIEAGLMGLWLLAVDGFQIAFARVGLTDTLFTLLFLLATWWSTWALDKGIWAALVAGILVGSTWNTKYNGAIPLVLTLGYLLKDVTKKRLTQFILISIVAGLAYAPWAIWFHVEHGYDALIQHQRGFFEGAGAILENARLAVSRIDAMQSTLPGLGLVLALGWSARRRSIGTLLFVGFEAAILALSWSAGLIALSLTSICLARKMRGQWLGWTWTLAWLAVLPALYTPYLRLWLPTESFAIILAASALGGDLEIPAMQSLSTRARFSNSRGLLAGLVILVAAVTWISAGVCQNRPILPRSEVVTGYRPAVEELHRWARQNDKRIVALARPPFYLYASVRGLPVERLAGDSFPWKDIDQGAALVVDRATHDSSGFSNQLAGGLDDGRLRLAARFPLNVGMITRFDDDRSLTQPAPAPNDRRWDLRVFVKGTPSFPVGGPVDGPVGDPVGASEGRSQDIGE